MADWAISSTRQQEQYSYQALLPMKMQIQLEVT